MITYPNQRVVTIFKEDYTNIEYKKQSKSFLQVDNDDWQDAAARLTHGGLKLYLYLASNKDGYSVALSPADIERKIGLSDSTYRRAFKELITEGYIEQKQGNVYWFNTQVQNTFH